jgi:FtsP/CotA-like multicopper oxidase with cupredoxin domain
MLIIDRLVRLLPASAILLFAWGAHAQSFRVQCPPYSSSHPNPAVVLDASGRTTTVSPVNGAPIGSTYDVAYPGAVKCQQISGGDGFATMGDGTQTYLFGFGPLSGLWDIYNGLPGTQTPAVFNQTLQDFDTANGCPSSPTCPNLYGSFLSGSGPSSLIGAPYASFTFNGGIGLVPDHESDPPGQLTGHVDPRMIMDVGVMNASQPAPLFAIDEDDEFFLTLTNVGQIMRPDLFEQHTVHFHGYPNASSFYDGVPDASIAINIGGSFTYYYLAPEAGTYFWHCHISPPEHLQMGMVGQIYVRPRQNRLTSSDNLRAALQAANVANARPFSNPDGWPGSTCNDILCSGQTPLPPTNAATGGGKYAYNDGDGSTRYDVEYPIQMMGFDPNFHFVGMTFNPESFTDMKDKYFMLNGRSYPDTINPLPMQTQSTDGTLHSSQPLPSIINIPAGGRALLRISDLSVTEHSTLASLGIPMKVIAINARLLRDLAGNDMSYLTNSITLGGGESLDVILDATGYSAGQKFYLYTPNLDHLSNDAENFGGQMTEVNICTSFDPTTKVWTGCPSI